MSNNKYFYNWISSLKYAFKQFGVNQFQINDRQPFLPRSDNNWIVQHSGIKKINYDGQGERVAVLDTGVDKNHIEIKGKVVDKCFMSKCNDLDLTFDYSGHGTFCIGEIVSEHLGVAPRATCLSAKILSGSGTSNNLHQLEKDLASAILYSCYDECGVISMSLGFPHKSSIVEDALKTAISFGVIPIASAGNNGMSGSPYKFYPASFEDCISVGIANEKNLPTWYSTAGQGNNPLEQPEISIASLDFHWGILPYDAYGQMSGTSIACPIVAGVALLWRQAMKEKGLMPTGKEVIKLFRKWLFSHAKDTNQNGWDNELGHGVLIFDSEDIL